MEYRLVDDLDDCGRGVDGMEGIGCVALEELKDEGSVK